MGKSSLIERFVKGNFKENSIPVTAAALFIAKENINIGNNKIELLIMDTPGNESTLTSMSLG